MIFLDTWKHFPETLACRDTLIARLGLANIQTMTPRAEGLKAEDPDGARHARNADLCCHVCKTLPMLKARGFPSVGCAPCARAVRVGEDARAGRWADSDQTECGIHSRIMRQGGRQAHIAGCSRDPV